MTLLTLRDILYRRNRILLVTLVVGLVLTLLFLMTGLVHQFKAEPRRTIEAFGADHWLVATGVGGPFTSHSALPLAIEDQLGGDESNRLDPVVVSRVTTELAAGPAEVTLIGARPGALPTIEIVDGQPMREQGDAVVDRSLGLSVGDPIALGGKDFRVVGLTQSATVLAGMGLVFIDLEQAQQMIFNRLDVVSAFLHQSSQPPDVAALNLVGLDPVVLTEAEVVRDTRRPIDDAISSIDLIRGLFWFVAALVMGAVIYLSALERERDYAVLKAVGAETRSLVGGVATLAAVIALLGASLAAVLGTVASGWFPLPVKIPTHAYALIPAVTAIISLGTAVFAVQKVNAADPVLAFNQAA